MKKRIFALALALCMMLSVMPTSFAGNGFLTLDGQENVEEQPREQQQEGILTLDDPDAVITQEPEKEPVYGVLTPDTSSEEPKAPVVEQSEGVLYVECPECGFLDGYHADDCPTQQPEDESPKVEETPAQEQTEPVVTIPQEPVVTNYTVETVSSTRAARTLNVARNAAIYNSLRLAPNEGEGENSDDETDQRVDTEGVVTDKRVVYDAAGNIDHLRLEAYVTGTTTTTTTTTPMDIVLVLDRSGSMGENNKMQSLIDALNGTDTTKGFLPTVQEKSPNSRVSIVTYADKGASTTDTGLISITKDGGVNSELTNIVSGLSNNKTKGGTYSAEGLERAVKVLQGVPEDAEEYNNKRIVILFTDGIPANGNWAAIAGISLAYREAQESIHWAHILKSTKGITTNLGETERAWHLNGGYTTYYKQAFYSNDSCTPVSTFDGALTGCGATVYCVGLGLPGANNIAASDGSKINEYLYRVSSHRVDGSHVQDGTRYNSWESLQGDWNQKYYDRYTRNIGVNYPPAVSYYSTTDDIGQLDSIFSTISSTLQTGTASVTLDSTTTVTDVISDYFVLPDGVTADDIRVYTADYTKSKTWADDVESSLTPTISGNTVTVTGFDFSKNYVDLDAENGRDENDSSKPGNFYGRKLIIEIPIKVADDFLGGENIPTNTTGSEIKNGDTVYEEFIPPTVDIPVDPGKVNLDWTADVTVSDQTVYLSNTADLRNMLSIPSGSLFDGVNNKFVTVTFKIGDAVYTIAPGATSGTWSGECIVDLDECTDYEIVCKIDGLTVTTGEGEAVTANTTTATVHVVKPVATFGEMNIYLSQTPDTTDLVAEHIDWVSTKGDGCTKPVSVEPDISYSYANDKADYKADTTLTATIHLDGTGNDRSVEQDDKVDVNVYLPNVKFVDTTIYLSNTANYADNFDSVVWKHGDTLANDEEMGAAPVLTYESFGYDKAAAVFTGCEDVTVNAVYIVGVNYKAQTVFVEGDKFTVHVLKPSFEITAPNIWADYKQSVDVDGYVTTEVTGWNDATNGHITIPAADESKKPDEEHAFSYTYTAKHGETVVETHNVGTTDEVFTVELAGFNIGTFEGNTNWYVSPEAKTFTVYVNKFDLTINKTWDAVEDCYKQDVIFTVTGDYGTGENQSIQVVIPVGKTSVKVVGLLCGQSYSVAESNPEGINWAWRFTNTQKPNVTCNVGHDVISTTEHPRHTVTADFINSNPATKWFDAIASKFNIFRKGGN